MIKASVFIHEQSMTWSNSEGFFLKPSRLKPEKDLCPEASQPLAGGEH